VEYASPGRLAAQRDVFRRNQADIWVLTETRKALVPEGCPEAIHSQARPLNSSKVKPDSHWVSIWSAFPMEEVSVDLADGKRTAVAMVELPTGGQMIVYGTVLPWGGDKGKTGQEKRWSEHHRVIPEQVMEWSDLQKRFEGTNLCVAGDYNTDLGTGSYYGTRQGIAALNAGLEACGLFCATAPDRVPPDMLEHPPIDHISLPLEWRDRVEVTAAWPAAKGVLSDHSGLIVSVDLR
jgi:endonuclease/exonuclease/phosphatase family metal-dependent hydrolase